MDSSRPPEAPAALGLEEDESSAEPLGSLCFFGPSVERLLRHSTQLRGGARLPTSSLRSWALCGGESEEEPQPALARDKSSGDDGCACGEDKAEVAESLGQPKAEAESNLSEADSETTGLHGRARGSSRPQQGLAICVSESPSRGRPSHSCQGNACRERTSWISQEKRKRRCSLSAAAAEESGEGEGPCQLVGDCRQPSSLIRQPLTRLSEKRLRLRDSSPASPLKSLSASWSFSAETLRQEETLRKTASRTETASPLTEAAAAGALSPSLRNLQQMPSTPEAASVKALARGSADLAEEGNSFSTSGASSFPEGNESESAKETSRESSQEDDEAVQSSALLKDAPDKAANEDSRVASSPQASDSGNAAGPSAPRQSASGFSSCAQDVQPSEIAKEIPSSKSSLRFWRRMRRGHLENQESARRPPFLKETKEAVQATALECLAPKGVSKPRRLSGDSNKALQATAAAIPGSSARQSASSRRRFWREGRRTGLGFDENIPLSSSLKKPALLLGASQSAAIPVSLPLHRKSSSRLRGAKKLARRMLGGGGEIERLLRVSAASSFQEVNAAILSSKSLSEKCKSDWLAMQCEPPALAAAAEAPQTTEASSLNVFSSKAQQGRLACCPLRCLSHGDEGLGLEKETGLPQGLTAVADCNPQDALLLQHCQMFKRTANEIRKKKRISKNAFNLESGKGPPPSERPSTDMDELFLLRFALNKEISSAFLCAELARRLSASRALNFSRQVLLETRRQSVSSEKHAALLEALWRACQSALGASPAEKVLGPRNWRLLGFQVSRRRGSGIPRRRKREALLLLRSSLRQRGRECNLLAFFLQQGSDPTTDFRGCGVLALRCLLFYAETFPLRARAALAEQQETDASSCRKCSFAITGINVAAWTLQWVLERKDASRFFLSCLSRASAEATFFHLFCFAMEEFANFWSVSAPPSILHFPFIAASFQAQLRFPTDVFACELVQTTQEKETLSRKNDEGQALAECSALPCPVCFGAGASCVFLKAKGLSQEACADGTSLRVPEELSPEEAQRGFNVSVSPQRSMLPSDLGEETAKGKIRQEAGPSPPLPDDAATEWAAAELATARETPGLCETPQFAVSGEESSNPSFAFKAELNNPPSPSPLLHARSNSATSSSSSLEKAQGPREDSFPLQRDALPLHVESSGAESASPLIAAGSLRTDSQLQRTKTEAAAANPLSAAASRALVDGVVVESPLVLKALPPSPRLLLKAAPSPRVVVGRSRVSTTGGPPQRRGFGCCRKCCNPFQSIPLRSADGLLCASHCSSPPSPRAFRQGQLLSQTSAGSFCCEGKSPPRKGTLLHAFREDNKRRQQEAPSASRAAFIAKASRSDELRRCTALTSFIPLQSPQRIHKRHAMSTCSTTPPKAERADAAADARGSLGRLSLHPKLAEQNGLGRLSVPAVGPV